MIIKESLIHWGVRGFIWKVYEEFDKDNDFFSLWDGEL
jgi:hypothetical protein